MSHIAAGGGLPGPVGVVLPWILAVLICIAVAGRTLSVWRLSVSVVASQILFHALFVLGAGPGDGTAPTGHAHGARGMALESSGVAQGDIGMWIAHVLAGVATIALLHRGELVVRALLSAGVELTIVFTTRFLGVTRSARADRESLRPPLIATPADLRPLGWDLRSVARRGPPATVLTLRLPTPA